VRAASRNTQVMILTSFEDEQKIIDAIQAGALSYLLKDADADTLADAVRRTARGESVLHPRIAARLLRSVRQPDAKEDPAAAALERLSQREAEVLGLMAEGLSNLQIAAHMGIGEEALANTLRHSHARGVRIALRGAGPRLELCLEDNGVGGADPGGGMGISNMRARAQALRDGHFELDSAPGAGTAVRVRCRYKESSP
jgi:signal transduction histidine kinase